MIETLPQRVDADPWLVHRGRFLNTSFLLEVGSQAWLVQVKEGRIAEVRKGPLVMPRWSFALRAAAGSWAEFWQPQPRAGFHDLMAMVKFRTLKVEGDQYPFVCNLQYIKDVLATLRGASA